MKRILIIGLLLAFIPGCTFDLESLLPDLPEGDGRIVVAVVDSRGDPVQDITVRLELKDALLSRSKNGSSDPEGLCILEGLGTERYSVTLDDLPKGFCPSPGRHAVSIANAEEKRLRFVLQPAGLVKARIGEPGHLASFMFNGSGPLVVIPESIRHSPLIAQRHWVAKNVPHWWDADESGAPEGSEWEDWSEQEECDREDSEVIAYRVPASTESYWAGVIGLYFWFWGLWARDGGDPAQHPDLFGPKQPEEPWTEPIVLRRVGPVRAGDVHELGTLQYPDWEGAAPVLEGHFLDAQGQPVMGFMTLLPREEGLGAFVVGTPEGAYRVAGLSPGSYRACLAAWREGRWIQRQFELEVPAVLEQRELQLE